MTKEIVNVVDYSPASILILEAMVNLIGDDGDLMEAFGCKGTDVEVQLLVNGVAVDVVKSIAEAWNRLEAHFEERAKERAIEMCAGAGLLELLEEMRNADWKIRQKLEAACLTN